MQITEIDGIGNDTATKLNSLGITTTKDVKFTSPEDLVKVLGIGVDKIVKLYSAAGIPLNSEKIATLNRMTENIKIEGREFSKGRVTINTPVVDDYSEKHMALADFLEEEPDEIEESSYDESQFEHGNEEYLVLTDSEADDKALESVKNSVEEMPEYYIDQAIMHNAIDEDWFERAEKESHEAFVEDIKDESSSDDDLYVNRLHEEMVKRGLIEKMELPDEPDENDYKNHDDYESMYESWEGLVELTKKDFENKVENNMYDLSEDMMSDDSVENFKDNFGEEDLKETIKNNNLIDTDKLAQGIFDDYLDRGNELSSYDGAENEIEYNGTYYFIYRTN